MSKRPSNNEIKEEMELLDEEFFVLSQRVNSLRGMLAKYVEYEQNERIKK